MSYIDNLPSNNKNQKQSGNSYASKLTSYKNQPVPQPKPLEVAGPPGPPSSYVAPQPSILSKVVKNTTTAPLTQNLTADQWRNKSFLDKYLFGEKAMTPTEYGKLNWFEKGFVKKETSEQMQKDNVIAQQQFDQRKQQENQFNQNHPKFLATMAGLADSTTLGLESRFAKQREQETGKDTLYSTVKKNNPGYFTAGQIGGYLIPGTIAEKGAGMLVKGSTLLPKLARGAIAGGVLGGGQSAIEGNSIKNIAKNTALGAGIGVGGELLGYGIGKGIAKIKSSPSMQLKQFTKDIAKTDLPINQTFKKPNVTTISNPKINVKNLTLDQNSSLGKLMRSGDIAVNEVTQDGLGNAMVNFTDNLGNTSKLNIGTNGKTSLVANIGNKSNYDNVISMIKKKQTKVLEMPIAVGETGNGSAARIVNKPTLTDIPFSPPPNKITPSNLKQRSFDKTIQQSEIVPQAIKNVREKRPMMYEPLTNEETYDNALNDVEKDFRGSYDKFLASDKLTSAHDTATGEALISKAIQNKDYIGANRIASELASKLTEAGQTVQAASIFKRLSPEGMLMYAEKTLGKINRDIEKSMGKVAKKVSLTPEESQFIVDGMTRVQSMTEGRAKDVELARIMQTIANKIPTNMIDKSRALRNISLLGNTKTFTRNIVGNTLMGVADNIANVVGTPIDKLISLGTKQRSVALPSLSKLGKGAIKGTSDAISDSFGGLTLKDLKGKSIGQKVKTLYDAASNPIDTALSSDDKFEIGRRLAFNNKPMRVVENAVNASLKLGDRPFSQAYYDDVLNQLMKANKVTEPTIEMKNIAMKVAQERTYQDTNSLSQMASKIKNVPRNLGNNAISKAGQVFADTLFPYIKTPMNILKRGIEYTPIGLAEGGTKLGSAIKKGTLDMAKQREIVDRLSRGIVGTGLGAGGYALAKKGLATGEADKDKDVSTFEKNAGKQPFAVKLGNNYYSFNWAQPVSMPFGAGVQMSKSKGDGTNTINSIIDGINAAGNYYADQPMLQSIQKIAGNSYDNKGVMQKVGEAALGLPLQFVPTALKQVAQMADNKVRETYSPDYFTNTIVNPIKAKIPGLSKTLPAKVDTLGNEINQYQGNNTPFNVMFNPGTNTSYNPNPMQEEILRLYNESGENIQVPRVVDKYIKQDGQTIRLTTDEYIQYQKELGQQTQQLFSNAMNSPKYQNMNDKNKAEMLQKIITKANQKAKNDILLDRGYKIKK